MSLTLKKNVFHSKENVSLHYTELMKRDARSSGSVTQIETRCGKNTGRGSGGRKRRNASDVRTRTGEGGKNDRMERTPTGSERRRSRRKRSVPGRRERERVPETRLVPIGRRSLPKRPKRKRIVKGIG